MILVDWQIKKLCEQTDLVTPYDETLVNPSSLDVRLGDTIILDNGEEYNISESFYSLSPNEFILGCTLEYLIIPDNCSIDFKLKSSRAREGWAHSLAAWAECGFMGCLTLELKNYRNIDLEVYKGLKIGQLIIHEHALPDESYKNTDYSYSKKPKSSRYVKI